jgi:hypothetical protein
MLHPDRKKARGLPRFGTAPMPASAEHFSPGDVWETCSVEPADLSAGATVGELSPPLSDAPEDRATCGSGSKGPPLEEVCSLYNAQAGPKFQPLHCDPLLTGRQVHFGCAPYSVRKRSEIIDQILAKTGAVFSACKNVIRETIWKHGLSVLLITAMMSLMSGTGRQSICLEEAHPSSLARRKEEGRPS